MIARLFAARLFSIAGLLVVAFGVMGFTQALERLAVAKSELVDEVWLARDEASEIVVDNSAWMAFLQTYVVRDADGINRVAYGDVTEEDEAALRGYIAMLQATDPGTLNGNEQLAYWTNLYNARTAALILQYYPVETIRAIRFKRFSTGPWNEPMVSVNGKLLTLNEIESGIVRPIWNDARIHYIFNCAALGCPNLGLEAYTGARIDEQMEAAAKEFINNPRGVRVEADGDLVLSKIFSWYLVDYGESAADILDHVRQYAEPELLQALEGRSRVSRYEYDWALNDTATVGE